MNSYFNLIYLIILFVFIIIAAFIATPLFLPNPSDLKLLPHVMTPKNLREYLYALYNNNKSEQHNKVLEDILRYKFISHEKTTPDHVTHYIQNYSSSLDYFNFIYENAPNDLKSSYNTAVNTSKSWPPKYNEKYRLLAFPYVSGNIFTGLYQTLAAKSGSATMPCWFISKYDCNDYSKSLYNRIFNRTIVPYKPTDSSKTFYYERLLNFFGNVVEYERTTEPYLLFNNESTHESMHESNSEYSIIKTGGYVLEYDYQNLLGNDPFDRHPLTKESAKTISSTLETNNKYISLEVQHTCFPMPGVDYPYCDDGSYWTYLAAGSGIYWKCKRPIIAKNKLHLLYCCGWSINDFVDITKNFGGGKNLVEVILKVIYNNEHPRSQKPMPGLGFRSMKGENGDIVVRKFFVSFIIFFFIIIYLLISICKNIFKIFKNFNDKSSVVLKSTYIIISLVIIFSLIWYFVFVLVNDFFIGLGWMTLDMAYEKTNLSPYKFFEEAIFSTNSNPICNGIHMSEWFDQYLYSAVSSKGFLSAIMTQQPNKSGCWMVEMFDVVKFVETDKSITPALGICGEQQFSSGIKYYEESSDGLPTLSRTVPEFKNCYAQSNMTGSESECEQLNDDSKIYNCYGCNDSNRSLCISCQGVPVSNVCIGNKKIHYSA